MNAREGRQLIERVLERLNDERARIDPSSEAGLLDWYANVEAAQSCCFIIQCWNKPAGFWLVNEAAA